MRVRVRAAADNPFKLARMVRQRGARAHGALAHPNVALSPQATPHRFRVGMTCEGCSGAVKRVLGRVEGVEEVTTDVAAKLVTVRGGEAAAVLAALRKWGDSANKSVEPLAD